MGEVVVSKKRGVRRLSIRINREGKVRMTIPWLAGYSQEMTIGNETTQYNFGLQYDLFALDILNISVEETDDYFFISSSIP